MFFRKTLSDHLAAFEKTVTALVLHAETKAMEAAGYTEAAASATEKAVLASDEAHKARAISLKIKDLIS